MNSLKPLLTIVVLSGIGYVVYTRLNTKPSPPPPGVAQGWDTAPTVQMPGENSGAAGWNGIGGANSGFMPPPAAMGGNTHPNTASAVSPFSPSLGGSAPPSQAASYGTGAPATAPTNGSAEPASAWGTTDPAASVPNTPTAPPGEIRYDREQSTSADQPGTAPVAADYGDAPAAADRNANAAEPSRPAYGSAGGNNEATRQFQTDWQRGSQMLEQGKLTEGLAELSRWYEHPELSATEQQQLTELLDQVAGTVIYSTQHQLESAYTVKPNERLEDIANQYDVPWQLLAKMNGIEDPASLQPGEQLKVIRGPFSALVSLEKRQLTLMLNGMYAGRFAIGLGSDMPAREGNFNVTEKVVNPTYHGRNRTIPADDPNNPLGERWISLGSDMGIHGTGPLVDIGATNQPGSLSLGPRDIEDVFDILSVGSKVMIVK